MALIQELTAGDERDAVRGARDIGIGVRLTELLASLGHEARLGRVYLAGDDLREHDMNLETLCADAPIPALRDLLDDYAVRAADYLARGLSAFTSTRPRQHYPLVAAALAAKRLQLMRRRAFPALQMQPRNVGPIRTWTAWRAARGHI
jgi:phytoene/squalene synthetase